MTSVASYATSAGSLFDRWRVEPSYRLINMGAEPEAWPVLPLAELELLAFDQCIVFGAACPGSPAFAEWAARRDRVVRQARDRLFQAYACVMSRMKPIRRIALMYEVADAIESGVGSQAALVPFTHWDRDDAVRAAAAERASRPLVASERAEAD